MVAISRADGRRFVVELERKIAENESAFDTCADMCYDLLMEVVSARSTYYDQFHKACSRHQETSRQYRRQK